MVLNFDETPEFQKDIKALAKKWRSIPSDLERAKVAITPLYAPVKGIDIAELRNAFFSTNRATILKSGDGYEVVKMRFDCASLGNDKRTRLVFIALVENSTIRFIELYAKSGKEREDIKRINKYIP